MWQRLPGRVPGLVASDDGLDLDHVRTLRHKRDWIIAVLLPYGLVVLGSRPVDTVSPATMRYGDPNVEFRSRVGQWCVGLL